MNPIFRTYQTEQDFWRMRDFLRILFMVNQQRERSWHVARLDYARWHSCLNCAEVGLEEVAYLWEVEDQITAFCTIWFDDVTRSAYFEPVATVPAHQRRGLGKAVITEGLRRL